MANKKITEGRTRTEWLRELLFEYLFTWDNMQFLKSDISGFPKPEWRQFTIYNTEFNLNVDKFQSPVFIVFVNNAAVSYGFAMCLVELACGKEALVPLVFLLWQSGIITLLRNLLENKVRPCCF
ncbi:MAG: hypothetical protein FWF61_06030 [Brevinematales bacterium]|nr:hypothetical protein [Brevinematales bacterium]